MEVGTCDFSGKNKTKQTTKTLNSVVGVINDSVPGCTCRLKHGIHQQYALGVQSQRPVLKEKIKPPKLIKAKQL